MRRTKDSAPTFIEGRCHTLRSGPKLVHLPSLKDGVTLRSRTAITARCVCFAIPKGNAKPPPESYTQHSCHSSSLSSELRIVSSVYRPDNQLLGCLRSRKCLPGCPAPNDFLIDSPPLPPRPHPSRYIPRWCDLNNTRGLGLDVHPAQSRRPMCHHLDRATLVCHQRSLCR